MTEWLYEDGIGEARAALVDHGTIIEARIEAPEDGPRLGAVLEARLGRVRPDRRAALSLPDGTPALLDHAPAGVSEGARLLVEVTRQVIPERGKPRPLMAKLAADGAEPDPGPSLLDRISASGDPVVRLLPHMPDALEQAGWSELLDEAAGGEILFPEGRLLVTPTPAMTLIDVDGQAPPAPLAIAGAAAAAHAILRMDIGGSIGIDLPTLPDRAGRLAAAKAIDAILPQPFERTAVNGFGFLQIVRRRLRPSLPERLLADPEGAAARALLRRAERSSGPGTRLLIAHPRVIARIEARGDWLRALESRCGAPIALQADTARPISAVDVQLQPR